MTEIPLRWKATRICGETLVDDGTCFDGTAIVGRVRLETLTNPKGSTWSLTAVASGRAQITISGVEDDKESAKERLEEAYRELLVAHPGNREYVLGRH